MTPELDGFVSYRLGAGAEDACGVGEELVASGAAKAKFGVKLGGTGGEKRVASGAKIWFKLGVPGGEELLASGAIRVESGDKLGATDREELVDSGAAKVKTGGKLVATRGGELVASGAMNAKAGDKLCAAVGGELVASDAAKVKTGVKLGATGGAEISRLTNGVIEVSLVLDGGWIAAVSTCVVSGVTVLDEGGACKTGAMGVVLALDEDFRVLVWMNS